VQEKSLIRVRVVDGHTVLRKRLCSLLEPNYGIEVTGEAGIGILL